MSPADALMEAIRIGRARLADMDATARVAPIESRGMDAAAYYALRGYVREIEVLLASTAMNSPVEGDEAARDAT